jgi:hypothetical protein
MITPRVQEIHRKPQEVSLEQSLIANCLLRQEVALEEIEQVQRELGYISTIYGGQLHFEFDHDE